MATQVEILMRTEGGPAAATSAGGAPSNGKEEGKEKSSSGPKKAAFAELSKTFSDKLGGAKKFFSKNLGLQFGLSSVLKQSQVFTSFVGTIFQLIGALVDVMLAPLLPLFFPLVRMLASAIPHAQKFGEYVAAELLDFFQGIKDWYISITPFLDEKWEEFKVAWGGGWVEVAKLIWDWVWTGLKWVWNMLYNTAIPWVWDKIKGLGNSIWDALKGFLFTAAGRVFGWFAQAYILIGKVRTLTNSILKWAVRVLPTVSKWAVKILIWGIKALPKLLGFGFRIAGFMLKAFLPGIGHIVVGLTRVGVYIVKGIMKAALGIVRLAFKWTFKLIGLLVGKATGAAKGLIGTLLKKITTALSGMKFFGGAFKKLGSALGFLKVAAKASKAIPVLGAVATLGFGVAETVSNTKKYGWQAGLATAGKTALAAGLAGVGQTYLSLGVDMGGSLAISQMAKRGAFGREGAHFQPGGAGYKGPPVVIKQTIVTASGETKMEETTQDLKEGEENTSNVTNVMQAASGSP